MAKYELMYIVGSQISDDEIPKTVDEIKKFIESEGGIIESHEELGKKKLAYPVKKTRNGFYVLDNFSAPADKINEIEHKIRTSLGVVRHLIVNMDDAYVRMEKDRVAQAKIKFRPREELKDKPAVAKTDKKIEIDLDAEIEKALESKDLK